jgi:hypothetical protein
VATAARCTPAMAAMLSTKLDILQRTAACNSQVQAGWFPEEEAEVAAYLNQQFYKFKD